MLLTRSIRKLSSMGGKNIKSLTDKILASPKSSKSPEVVEQTVKKDQKIEQPPAPIEPPVPPPLIEDSKDANRFAESISPDERRMLYVVLRKKSAEQYYDERTKDQAEVDSEDMVRVMKYNYVPQFAAGAFQNFIMIVAGQTFDRMIGESCGVSIMAAAAIGNIVSNSVALLVHRQLEVIENVCGLKLPPLSVEQKQNTMLQYSTMLSKIIGLVSGGLSAMLILYIYDTPPRPVTAKSNEKELIEKRRAEKEQADLEKMHENRITTQAKIVKEGMSKIQKEKGSTENKQSINTPPNDPTPKKESTAKGDNEFSGVCKECGAKCKERK